MELVMRESVELVTTYRCPFCRSRALELLEDDNNVWFDCVICLRYVKMCKRELVWRFVKNGEFMWSAMLRFLYDRYVHGCHK
ncbi:MAG: hypothetical protein ACK4SY_09740 [Pyrobaculum sp.]